MYSRFGRVLLPVLLAVVLFLACNNNPTNPVNPFIPNNGVYQILLEGATSHSITRFDTLIYHAVVTVSDSTVAPDNTPVRWSRVGNGAWQNQVTFTRSGIATNFYIPPTIAGVDTLRATVIHDSITISSAIALSMTPPNSTLRLDVRFGISPPLMYATGRDSLGLYVTLRDSSDIGVRDAVLSFSTNRGLVRASATTDSSGAVHTYLKDGLDTTSVTGSYLYVRCPALNLIDSALFFIRPMLSLGRIILSGPTSHTAIPTDTIHFTATAFLQNNNYAYDSTTVHWYCYQRGVTNPYNIGIGHWISPTTKTANGMTTNTFVMGQGLGFDSLVVMATSPNNNETRSEYIIFQHTPGNPAHITFYPRSFLLYVNGPPQVIGVVVTDTFHNCIPNLPILWGCTNGAGTISDDGHSITGDTAYARLTPGSIAGRFQFWVSTTNGINSDTINFTVTSSTPRTLTLASESQIIQVAGTGGNSSTNIHAIIRDANGNPVSGGTPVLFKITNVMQFSDTIAYRPYFNTPGLDSITAVTSGLGEAVATLTAGRRSGAVQIQAWVLVPDNPRTARDNITATLSNVQVVSGPPDRITIGVNNDNGVQEGGGTWSIWANATVRDRYCNPVVDHYAVAFSITPGSLAQVGLDTCFTNNAGPNNQHIRGVAFTRMNYQGQNSFDTITLRGSVVSFDINNVPIIVSDSLRFALPLQQGVLQLNVSPNTFFFCRAIPPYFPTQIDAATHMLWATVRDGYGQPIHGCPVLFSVQRGKIYKTIVEATNRTYTTGSYRPGDNTQLIPGTTIYWPVNKRKTGNYTVPSMPALNWTDPNGMGSATVYIGVLGPSFGYTGAGGPVGEVFLDPQTSETTSEVTAIIEGYPSVQSVRVVITYQRS